MLLGGVLVFSSSYYFALNLDVHPHYFSIRQLIWIGVSLVLFLLFIHLDYHILQKYVRHLVFLGFILLLLVFIPGIGKTTGGATRWIDFRIFALNPSEFSKLIVIIYLSYILTKKQAKLEDFTFGILPPLLLVATLFFLILMQSGFSTGVVLLLVAFVMFFIGGASVKHILSVLLLSLPVLGTFIYRVAYRKDRIFALLDPWEDPTGRGYQVIQSLRAFAQGGILGKGIGNSTQKIRNLPTPHNDFIYAVIAEELGLWGGLLILGLFVLFFIRGMLISLHARDKFGQMLGFGIVTLITLHAFLNVGIASGLLPPTGISLPFLSYGGSSMIVMSVSAGILLNISSQNHLPASFADNTTDSA